MEILVVIYLHNNIQSYLVGCAPLATLSSLTVVLTHSLNAALRSLGHVCYCIYSHAPLAISIDTPFHLCGGMYNIENHNIQLIACWFLLLQVGPNPEKLVEDHSTTAAPIKINHRFLIRHSVKLAKI